MFSVCDGRGFLQCPLHLTSESVHHPGNFRMPSMKGIKRTFCRLSVNARLEAGHTPRPHDALAERFSS